MKKIHNLLFSCKHHALFHSSCSQWWGFKTLFNHVCIFVFQWEGRVIRIQVDNIKIVTFVLLIEVINHCNFSSKLVMHSRYLESPLNHMLTRLSIMFWWILLSVICLCLHYMIHKFTDLCIQIYWYGVDGYHQSHPFGN